MKCVRIGFKRPLFGGFYGIFIRIVLFKTFDERFVNALIGNLCHWIFGFIPTVKITHDRNGVCMGRIHAKKDTRFAVLFPEMAPEKIIRTVISALMK